MKKIRLGIIGVGNMGTGHCKSILNGDTPEIALTAVADIRQDRREAIKALLPKDVVVFETAEELIQSDSCDAVLVATPHYEHPKFSIMALEHGKHVMCEKPAGVYTKQVRQMNEVAEKSNLVFGMMFNQRTSHVYRKMHEIVQSGEYGQLKRVNWIVTNWYRSQIYYNSGGWRATWDGEGGGVLLNQCPHNLDLLQWICGMPCKVQAHCHNGKWHNIEVEDDVTAYMEFPNGATGVFVTTTADLPGTNRLEITLERAKLVSEDEQLKMFVLDESERELCFSTQNPFLTANKIGKWIEVETDGLYTRHVGVLNAFAGKILHGTPLVAEGTEGINGLMLSNAMHLSSWLNQMVALPVDEDLFLEELNKLRKSSQKKEEVSVTEFSMEDSFK